MRFEAKQRKRLCALLTDEKKKNMEWEKVQCSMTEKHREKKHTKEKEKRTQKEQIKKI